MPHYLYIIYSNSLDSFYVGESRDCVERLHQHKTGYFKSSSTSKASDWELKRMMEVGSISEARKVERYLKSMKSKRYLRSMIENEEFYFGFKK